MTEIPNIKLNPKDILPILCIIEQYENDKNALKKNIHDYLTSVSPHGKISYRNAVFALSFHTLRILKLIDKRGEKLKLSSDAETLLRVSAEEGNESYLKQLAKTVAKIDFESVGVLKSIDEFNEDSFTVTEIEKKLKEMKIESPTKGGSLSKWLRLLKYVHFIEKTNGHYKYNSYQLKALNIGLKEMTLSDFFSHLKTAYDELTKRRRGNPYIPIPELEDIVCRRLINKGFMTFDFRNYLKKLKDAKINGFTVYLSKPGAREANGLRIDGVYYYYIAIFGE